MSDHELWNELGNLYFLSGAYEPAIHAYTKAIEINRQFGRPYSNIALVYVQKGQYDRAIALVQHSLTLLADPREKAISWNRLGNIYRQRKDYSMAIAAYQKADEADPQSGNAQDRPGRNADAPLTITVPTLELSLADPIPGLLNEGPTEETPSETHSPAPTLERSAVEMIEKPEESIPIPEETVHVPAELVQILEQETGEPEMLIRDEDIIVETLGTAVVVDVPLPSLGESTTETEDEEARVLPENLQKTVEETMHNLMLCAPSARAEEEDESNLAEFIDLAGKDESNLQVENETPICIADHSEMLLLTDGTRGDDVPPVSPTTRKDISQNPVVKELKVILERNPQDAAGWDALGNLYKANGFYREATAAYEEALLLEAGNPSFNYHLGLVYAATERHEEALGLFKRVVKFQPNNGLAHATLSGCYRRLGLDELARHHLQKAIFLNNTFQDENEYNRACFESICGNTDRALEYLELALQAHQPYAQWALHDPDLDFIRNDSRFAALIARHSPVMNLDDQIFCSRAESAVTV
jgi:tetratricopeptide (TPR) repeat protein